MMYFYIESVKFEIVRIERKRNFYSSGIETIIHIKTHINNLELVENIFAQKYHISNYELEPMGLIDDCHIYGYEITDDVIKFNMSCDYNPTYLNIKKLRRKKLQAINSKNLQ